MIPNGIFFDYQQLIRTGTCASALDLCRQQKLTAENSDISSWIPYRSETRVFDLYPKVREWAYPTFSNESYPKPRFFFSLNALSSHVLNYLWALLDPPDFFMLEESLGTHQKSSFDLLMPNGWLQYLTYCAAETRYVHGPIEAQKRFCRVWLIEQHRMMQLAN